MPPAPDVYVRLAAFLSSGGLVAVPTETVYGLAANGLDAAACGNVFATKQRPANDPLILHVYDHQQVDKLTEAPDALKPVAKAFWPGPLTVVLKRRSIVPDCVTSGGDTVAIRMPAHPVMRELLQACDFPLAAPSANPFGYISPTRAEHVMDSLGGKIRYILDGGPCSIGLESTILDLSNPDHPAILRPGKILRSEIEEVLGQKVIDRKAAISTDQPAKAPGMLSRHYSPRKPLTLFKHLPPSAITGDPEVGFIFLNQQCVPADAIAGPVWSLSEDGDLNQAGQELFHVLRTADNSPVREIFAEAPADPLAGAALIDRLQRAAARF